MEPGYLRAHRCPAMVTDSLLGVAKRVPIEIPGRSGMIPTKSGVGEREYRPEIIPCTPSIPRAVTSGTYDSVGRTLSD